MKHKDLPKSLKVFGINYKIKVVDLPYSMAGQCHRENHQIWISSTLEDKEIASTCLHELFHAALHRVSVTQAITPELEEVIVDTLSNVLTENFDIIHIK